MSRSVGIEALSIYGGGASLDVAGLAAHRGLDASRFANLMIREKSMALPFEDPVTFGVNAAKPLVDALSPAERDRIEMVVTCTESGIDFGKSLSTYVHHHLGLSRACRLFEIKQACYSGTAGLQMAVNFVLSQCSPGAKALVVATDISRFALGDQGAIHEWSFSEPTSGAGAAALLVGEMPHVLAMDVGAYGHYGFEVMDTCRPGPDTEAGDADLSLLAYLECSEKAFGEYAKRVDGADFTETFDYLCFHTPFGGMVKGAHRNLMRKLVKAPPARIDEDFRRRMLPGLALGERVGNTAGASVFFSLAGLLQTADIHQPKRVGLFSYGSGCCSEFYSGVVTPEGQQRFRALKVAEALAGRYRLSIDEYELLLQGEHVIRFGTRDAEVARNLVPAARQAFQGSGRLVLDRVKNYHREYSWA